MSSSEVEPIYETLKVDNEYEITTNTEPHIIRRISTGHIVSVWDNGNLLTMMLSVPSELSIIPPPLHGSCERRCQEKFSITAFP